MRPAASPCHIGGAGASTPASDNDPRRPAGHSPRPTNETDLPRSAAGSRWTSTPPANCPRTHLGPVPVGSGRGCRTLQSPAQAVYSSDALGGRRLVLVNQT
jgi:hypothetical protein